MGKHIVNAHVTVDSVDLSEYVSSVDLNMPYDDHDVTGMGATSHEHLSGLRDDSITLNFWQDFDASAVHATLGPIHANQDVVAVVVKPRDATVSATNPSFTQQSILQTYSPLTGAVGEPAATEVTFQCGDGAGIVEDDGS